MSAVLVCGPVEYIHPELKALAESGVEIVHLDSPTRAHFFARLAEGGDYSQIVAIYRNNYSSDQIGIFDADLVNHFPPSLRFICHLGAGYDQIDVQACTARGIAVSSTPGVVDASTATTGMFLIISALRSFWKMQQTAQRGNFKEGCEVGNDPEGKVLGIIGLGGIGKALAKRALGFDMKIQYHNRKPLAPAALAEFPAGSITYVESMDILLSTSDVVSLSIPLNEKTKGSFGAAQFAAMKQSACFINTARGAIVDESAMLQALKSGKLGSVGLDVFPNEPHINPELLAMDNVVVLPHAGTHSIETQRAMELKVLENIKSALSTGKLTSIVDEQQNVTF